MRIWISVFLALFIGFACASPQKTCAQENPEDIAAALLEKGRQQMKEEKYGQAIETFETLVAFLEKNAGPQHEVTIDAKNMLAQVQRNTKRVNKVSKREAERFVQKFKQQTDRGANAYAQGDPATAHTIFRNMLAEAQALFGKDHPEVQETYSKLTYLIMRTREAEAVIAARTSKKQPTASKGDSTKTPAAPAASKNKQRDPQQKKAPKKDIPAPAQQKAVQPSQPAPRDEAKGFALPEETFAALPVATRTRIIALLEEATTIAQTDSPGKASQLYAQLLQEMKAAFGENNPAMQAMYQESERLIAALAAEEQKRLARPSGKTLLSLPPKDMEKFIAIASNLNLDDFQSVLEAYKPLMELQTIIANHLGPQDPMVFTLASQVATCAFYLGETQASLLLFSSALQGMETTLGFDNEKTLETAFHFAVAHQHAENFQEAMQLFTRVHEAKVRLFGAQSAEALEAQIHIAQLQSDSGNYTKASTIFAHTVPLLEKAAGPDNLKSIAAHDFYGQFYRSLGDYANAETQFVQALQGIEQKYGKADPNTEILKLGLAKLYLQSGKLAEAQRLAQFLSNESLIFSKKHNKPAPDTILATLLLQQEQFTAATKLAASVVASLLETKGAYNSETVKAQAMLAKSLTGTAELEEAYKQGAQALLHAMGTPASKSTELATVPLALAGVYRAKGQPELAIFYHKLAVLALREMRTQLHGMERSLQQTYLNTVESHYHTLIDLLVQANRKEEALTVVYFLKEDELDDTSRSSVGVGSALDLMVGEEVPLYREYSERANKLQALGTQRHMLAGKEKFGLLAPGEGARLIEVEAGQRIEEAAFMRFLKTAEETLRGKQDTLRNAGIGLKNMQELRQILRSSGQGTALIHTISSKEMLYIFCTTPNTLMVQGVALSRNALRQHVEQLLASLRNPQEDPRPAAQALYSLLLAPFEETLERTHTTSLLFSLDSALRYVPMASLHNGKHWLVERFDLTVFTEAARHTLRAMAPARPHIAAMGVTRAMAGFPALPSVGKELHGIVQQAQNKGGIPGTVDLDTQFTQAHFTRRLQQGVPIVHVASHFYFNPMAQQASFLLLGDGNKLSMADMFTVSPLPFTGVTLLTLSACDTATGKKMGDGREVESFGALAQKHGAQSVIAALWPVVDDSTASLMQYFYETYAQEGVTKAQALQRAQLRLITNGEAPQAGWQRGVVVAAEAPQASAAAAANAAPANPAVGQNPALPGYSHPYYWAPFVLMGNWR